MPDNPSQLTQLFHDATPTVLGAVAILIAIILLVAIIDGINTKQDRRTGRRLDVKSGRWRDWKRRRGRGTGAMK